LAIAAGRAGIAAGTVLSSILCAKLLESSYHFRWWPAAVARPDGDD
jgi:hypothetical protein